MINKLRKQVSRHLNVLTGWRTSRKIVVIESDDWGSIRMPSKEVYEQCLKAGYRVDRIAYERYDSLASEDDLELLFDLLSSYKDINGNSAVLTANVLSANPDFNKIKASGYNEYSYELVTETFKRYPKHAECFSLWHQGKDARIFFPQSHGREHLNVALFMQALQQADPNTHFGFTHEMPGAIQKGDSAIGNPLVESLRYKDKYDKERKLEIVLEGLDLFETLFGYRSETFIPPNYLWCDDYDKTMAAAGVRYYQGRRKMIEPQLDGGIELNTRTLGDQNEFGQTYLIRNAYFEPSLNQYRSGTVTDCLKDISTAFRFGKPATITSHRLNYVGYIDQRNRDKNLRMLKKLLDEVVNRWPDVEFLNSKQLGTLIIN